MGSGTGRRRGKRIFDVDRAQRDISKLTSLDSMIRNSIHGDNIVYKHKRDNKSNYYSILLYCNNARSWDFFFPHDS